MFGLAAVEAMAAGTPVLATDNCGLGEVVRTVQGKGTYRDLDVLAADLERVALGSDRFPSPEALRAGVAEQFSTERMADVYLERGREALNGGW